MKPSSNDDPEVVHGLTRKKPHSLKSHLTEVIFYFLTNLTLSKEGLMTVM